MCFEAVVGQMPRSGTAGSHRHPRLHAEVSIQLPKVVESDETRPPLEVVSHPSHTGSPLCGVSLTGVTGCLIVLICIVLVSDKKLFLRIKDVTACHLPGVSRLFLLLRF